MQGATVTDGPPVIHSLAEQTVRPINAMSILLTIITMMMVMVMMMMVVMMMVMMKMMMMMVMSSGPLPPNQVQNTEDLAAI